MGSIRIPCPYLEWIDRFDPHADGGDELSVPQTDDQRGQATLLGSHAPSRGKPSVHRVAELETRPKRIFTMRGLPSEWIQNLSPPTTDTTQRHSMRTEPLYNKPRPPHAVEKAPEPKPKPKATTRPKVGSRDLREDRGTRQIKNTPRPPGPQQHP